MKAIKPLWLYLLLICFLHLKVQAQVIIVTPNGKPVMTSDSKVVLSSPCPVYSVKDIDGNEYPVISIGSQCWFQRNLATTRYNDGLPISTTFGEWDTVTPGAYCWYNNDATTYKNIYGALYSWFAVDTGILCPSGWHVPTDSEWTELTTFLNGAAVAGGKLKETGTIHWQAPNTDANNKSGFTALPGGVRNFEGIFYNIGIYGSWWSSTGHLSNAWIRGIPNVSGEMERYDTGKQAGFSVRCLLNN